MKIRPSLRIYVLLAILVTGVTTILVLSALSINYFISGMDVAMRGSMIAQAQQEAVKPGEPMTNQEFTVATRWSDLPQGIRTHIEQSNVELNVISKKILGKSIFAPPKEGYFVMKVMKGDQVRYVSAVFDQRQDHFLEDKALPHFVTIFLTALAAIILFFAILVLILRKVASPVEQLKNWAKLLDKDNLCEPTPDFHFSELNTLANIIRDSLSSVQSGLEREQKFLGYASHELRTPIAVTRTNSELLEKLIKKGKSQEKQLEVIDRIKRAGFTMTDLTETLLWLTRQQNKDLPVEHIHLGELLRQINHDLTYLLNGKAVVVNLESDDTHCQLPVGLTRIVLTNLIRNAFQHTGSGTVRIVQSGSKVTIVNHNTDGTIEDNHLGFGLGLELTEKLLAQYQWQYHNQEQAGGREVWVDFS
ncbi:sensor histidine kinase [Vibrio cyclitrophicus]|uniref:sensor histidine kinase n=1 Tax=Vibrio cyclitrophicus TaxID=47951 RepID=UPI00036B1F9C|nr:HAMP domain-containing sensor histidine kinase [Vibrio cyclitrophicus]OBS92440.1 histidine kinase [Vibrio cyclitrophicus]OEE85377.1 histidine kinase [Vibrio cyclitrophicus FF160]OEF27869.1 histidine kinase [Vibrio cyclitrophicus 1F97]OEF45772.1 histidine kinase [Vibrio cyclitrophicus 1F273]OEF77267.1 histidine kinase [Vibrio cyclitrophicus 1F111]